MLGLSFLIKSKLKLTGPGQQIHTGVLDRAIIILLSYDKTGHSNTYLDNYCKYCEMFHRIACQTSVSCLARVI